MIIGSGEHPGVTGQRGHSYMLDVGLNADGTLHGVDTRLA